MAMSDSAWDEPGEDDANRVWLKLAVTRTAVYLLTVLTLLGVVVCDYVFAVIAFWFLPGPAAGVLALAMGAELGSAAVDYRDARRADRAARPAHQSEGERWSASVARMQKPPSPPWWRLSPLRGRFWLGLLSRALYSACFALVVGHWAGSADAGLAAGVLYTFWSMALGAGLPRAQLSLGRVLAFSDPSAPRDTPEI
jgi:hypothetical protein